MKKNDVYDFVVRVEKKAVKSIEEKHNKAVNKLKEKSYKKCKKEMELFTKTLQDIEDTYNKIAFKLDNDSNLKRYGGYKSSCTTVNLIKSLKDKNIEKMLEEEFNYDGEIIELIQKRNQEKQEVVYEYRKVLAECKRLTSAKKCVEYLNDLGFDTSSLMEKEKKEEKTSINKSKLFVCGDNK